MRSLTLLVALFFCIKLSAIIIHVPVDKPKIQDGINAAFDGDTVLVSPGLYFENINFNGKNIVVASMFLLTNDTSYLSQTIIDGNLNGSVVTFSNGESNEAQLVGFTIKNGSGTYVGNGYFGGGIYCINSSPTIRNNIIKNNSANAAYWLPAPCDGEGGGIYSIFGSLVIKNNVIRDNYAWGLLEGFPGPWSWGSGGGIYVEASQCCLIDNNEILNNRTGGGYAGGICCKFGYITIINNLVHKSYGEGISLDIMNNGLIQNNKIQFNDFGGISLYDCHSCQIVNNLITDNDFRNGIYSYNTTSKIINNTIVRNTSLIPEWGGGILFENSTADVINNIIAFNINKGIHIYDTLSVINIAYNNFWNNPEGHTKIPIGDTSWGKNYNGIPCDFGYNIYRNPLFENFPSDLKLNVESPCINAGDPDSNGFFLPQADLDGNPRIYGSRIDQGAYEYSLPNSFFENFKTMTSRHQLFQNYPNPFKNSTTISFFNPKNSVVLLKVFDIKGKEIRTLINGLLPKGLHQLCWDGSDESGNSVAEGIYLCHLQIGAQSKSKKIILLK
ncbi:MAG: right-handed parallel beta-helix repeat-containing protein [Bacteroidales bacterium]|nr:right-handed parallel beta-helix repeat-containing protein [Bacteroidales bacterium]